MDPKKIKKNLCVCCLSPYLLNVVEILLQGSEGVEYNQVKVQRLKEYVLTLNDNIGGKEILHGKVSKQNNELHKGR